MPVDSSWLRQGAVNVKQGSTDIVGVGTLWKGQITAGDLFLGPDGAWYEVAAAAADTSLQLRTPYQGATAGNQPYAVVRNFTAQPWSDTASRLSEMVLLWRMTLKGFNDVLRSDAPTVTLYDEAGAGFPVMSWKGADKAIKDALAGMEAARKVVVDGSADLLAYRDAAGASAKAAKTSQDASGVSAAAAANSLAAVRLSESNVAASLATVRDLQGKAQASQVAADASAKAAASSQAAAATSEAKLADAASVVDQARQISSTMVKKGDPIKVAAPNGAGAALDVFSTGSGKLTAYGPKGDGCLLDLDAVPADGDQSSSIRMFRAVKTTGPAMLDMYAADGTSTLVHRFGVRGTDSYLHQQGGRVQIGRVGMPSRLDVVGSVRANTFRAAKGLPNNDDASVGFAFGPDGDTGMFTDYSGQNENTGSRTINLRVDSQDVLIADVTGGMWAKGYGWLHEKFASKATTLAGYGITDAQPQSANLAALAKLDAVGLYASTGAGGATVRTLTAGQGISVANGDGKAGNPAIGLSSDSAAALQRVRGTIKEVFVPGDRDTFYPVGVSPNGDEVGSGYTMAVRVFRSWVHEGEPGLGSYSADIWARLSCWGNTAGEVFSVMQRQGGGAYSWGVGRVEARGRTPWLILWLRGGMSHTIQLLDVVSDLKILLPGKDGKVVTYESAQFGNEVWEPLKGDDKQPLYGLLNFEVRPHAPLKFESLERSEQIFVPRPATDVAGANGYLIPGAYRVELGGQSALLAEIQCDGGSTPRLQLIAKYGNELWFRTARDRHENWDGVGLQQNRIWHSGNFDPSAPRVAAQFTRATLPAAGSMPGAIAYITDGPSGPTHVFSNGQKWRVPALTDL
ncbi:hypothetical protein [Chromobacterium amazonense]|uniref:hypothetical protein n=1 Tax=Chromobacterium amazonense TaxID=1382803 RepID=UPI003F79A551